MAAVPKYREEDRTKALAKVGPHQAEVSLEQSAVKEAINPIPELHLYEKLGQEKRKTVAQATAIGGVAGTGTGAAAGGGIGVLIGGVAGSVVPGPGTLIGMAAGAAIGAAIGGGAGLGGGMTAGALGGEIATKKEKKKMAEILDKITHEVHSEPSQGEKETTKDGSLQERK